MASVEAIKRAEMLLEQGQASQAADILHDVLRNGLDAAAVHHLGLACHALGDADAAWVFLALSLNLDRDNRGFRERVRSVAEALKAAVELHTVGALYRYSVDMSAQHRPLEAYAAARLVVATAPGRSRNLFLQGYTAGELGWDQEAMACYDEALELDPDNVGALVNRGNLLVAFGEWERAAEGFGRVLELEQDHPGARLGLGQEQLRRGDWNAGWQNYEARTRCATVKNLRLARPLPEGPEWRGDRLDGKRVLVYAEQGLGDTLMFARYLRALKREGAEVVLEVQTPLVSLLGASGLADEVIANTAQRPPCDLHCSLLSLPALLPGVRDVAADQVPYLRASDAARLKWETLLGPHRYLRVGLCWGGRPRGNREDRRSVPMEELVDLVHMPEVEFLSLQLGSAARDSATLGLKDLTQYIESMDDTAALVEQADIVISIDTSVAHLAGALGQETWLLLPHACDWRWQNGDGQSLWYPTATLFRQGADRDWLLPVDRVINALGARAGAQTVTLMEEPEDAFEGK